LTTLVCLPNTLAVTPVMKNRPQAGMRHNGTMPQADANDPHRRSLLGRDQGRDQGIRVGRGFSA
jgi:hypothetical protein